MKIYKYVLKSKDEQLVHIPIPAKILCVREQGDSICIWALVDETKEHFCTYKIGVFGTGHAIPENVGKYLGTAHLLDGQLVFHVFLMN